MLIAEERVFQDCMLIPCLKGLSYFYSLIFIFFLFFVNICGAPILGVLLTTRQPAETYEYRVLQYHTHMSHISRPITVYFSYK